MSSNGMVRRDDAAQASHGITRALVPQSMPEAWQFAQAAAKSNLYAVKSAESALMILSTGLDLGLAPSQALRGIDIIEGKPRLSADLMVAVVKARRDLCKYFRLVESTDERAEWETWREGEPEPVRMAFTKADAEKAGLWGRSTWKAHARTMLRHRAASQLARAVFQDVLFGIYTPDEHDDIRESRAHEPPPAPQRATVSNLRAVEHRSKPSEQVTPESPAEDVAPSPHSGGTPIPPNPSDPIHGLAEEDVVRIEKYKARIAAASSLVDLNALAPEIKALPEAMRRELRPVFEARREELRRPPPAGGPGPRPANDGEAKGEAHEGGEADGPQAKAWREHLAAHAHPQAVANSYAKHLGEYGPAERMAAIAYERAVALDPVLTREAFERACKAACERREKKARAA
jgi:hypothetical protein